MWLEERIKKIIGTRTAYAFLVGTGLGLAAGYTRIYSGEKIDIATLMQDGGLGLMAGIIGTNAGRAIAERKNIKYYHNHPLTTGIALSAGIMAGESIAYAINKYLL